MKKRSICILIAIPLILALGIGSIAMGVFNNYPRASLSAIDSDPGTTLYSLHPKSVGDMDPSGNFTGSTILGQTVLADPAIRKSVIRHLRRSTRSVPDAAACFLPRHAIRATDPTGTYTLLICHECRHALAYRDGKRLGETISIRPDSAILDSILQSAGIPLDQPPSQ